MTANAAPALAVTLGIDTPTACAIYHEHPDPVRRREVAALAVTRRRGELRLLADLLVETGREKLGGMASRRAKLVDRLERDDQALADLIVLTVA